MQCGGDQLPTTYRYHRLIKSSTPAYQLPRVSPFPRHATIVALTHDRSNDFSYQIVKQLDTRYRGFTKAVANA